VSVSFTVRGQRRCVELVDYKGEVHAYAFDVVVDLPHCFAVRLAKLDDPDEPVYLVQLGRGWHRCDCPDARYRKRECKHARLIRDPDFRALVRMLAVVPQDSR
jgi:hypothetical protein